MKQYGAILIDPPWAFRTYNREKGTTPHRGAEDIYPTMREHEIAGLPVPDLAAKNCAMFMWVVDSHLEIALQILPLWGFAFKTRVFTWGKTKAGFDDASDAVPDDLGIGMGYWSRKQTEICLLATKGSPRRRGKDVREFIAAPRREHSRKPDEIYDRIERLVDGPYLEMFARKQRPGWDAWGNETTKFNTVEDLFE